MDTIGQLTWQGIAQPAALGLAAAILMVVLLKPLIRYLIWEFTGIDPVDAPDTDSSWPRRYGVIVMLMAFLVSMGLAAWRLWGAEAGEVFLVGLVGEVAAVTEYETVKNIVGAFFGYDISKFTWMPTTR